MIGGTSGSETKLCQPCSSQSKITQTRSSSAGSRKTIAPLEPCCLRFSAPFGREDLHEPVEVLDLRRCEQHRRSPFVGVLSSWWAPSCGQAGEGRRADQALLRIDRAEALDDLEPAVARLGDVHVHAHVVLAGHHRRRAARALGDLRVVERRDHVVLLERARLGRPRPPRAAARGTGPSSALPPVNFASPG